MARKRNANEENVPPIARFKFSFDDDKLNNYSKGYQPQTTISNTSWAMRVFEGWRSARNSAVDFEEDLCPDDLFVKGNKDAISNWLGRFAIEVRRQDGKPYPPRTIHHLFLGIQRHVKTICPERNINFFGDPEFIKHKTCAIHIFESYILLESAPKQKLLLCFPVQTRTSFGHPE